MLGVVGCVDDPQDPKTWIKKLGDVREGKEAMSQLVKLKNPAAVPPLIELYKKTKDTEVLKALGTFHDKSAVPLFVDALDYSEDQFEGAANAATALGDIGDPSAIEPLAKTLAKPLSIRSRANIVKLEAMKALVKIHDKNPAPDDKAVEALAKVVETSADEQDFMLNNVAAQSLSHYDNAKAVPALVRGLFMTGRGADIFQPCRVALISVGKPAIPALMDAFNHKNTKLEADADKYKFRPGVIEQKMALMLGDLRAKEAVPTMIAELKKPQKGDNHTGALYCIGMVGDPANTKEIVSVLQDAKRDWKVRLSAAEALNLSGDPSAEPALLTVAKSGDVTKDGQKYPDVRLAAAISYSRLGGAAEAAAFAPVAAAEKNETTKPVFDEAGRRLEVGKKCDKNWACYGDTLVNEPILAKQEKAAFMLARWGKDAVPFLVKKLSSPEDVVRLAVLFALGKTGKGSAEAKKALEVQIEADKTKPPKRGLVEEMRATLAMIK
jgi:HEAT repeat protein